MEILLNFCRSKQVIDGSQDCQWVNILFYGAFWEGYRASSRRNVRFYNERILMPSPELCTAGVASCINFMNCRIASSGMIHRLKKSVWAWTAYCLHRHRNTHCADILMVLLGPKHKMLHSVEWVKSEDIVLESLGTIIEKKFLQFIYNLLESTVTLIGHCEMY